MQDRFFIAAQLRQISELLQVKGENPFKARAYERAAEALERLDADLGAPVLRCVQEKRELDFIPAVEISSQAVEQGSSQTLFHRSSPSNHPAMSRHP